MNVNTDKSYSTRIDDLNPSDFYCIKRLDEAHSSNLNSIQEFLREAILLCSFTSSSYYIMQLHDDANPYKSHYLFLQYDGNNYDCYIIDIAEANP